MRVHRGRLAAWCAKMAWQYYAQGALSFLVPLPPGEAMPMGPCPVQEVALSVAVMTGLCWAVGRYLTRSDLMLRCAARLHPADSFRDEAWDEVRLGLEGCVAAATAIPDEESDVKAKGRQSAKRRFATELLFITVHNGTVSVLALLAWLLGSPSLALHAFALEVAYEVFDSFSLGLLRLEPETLIHHIVSPICILCSTQTEVDFRVLCHLCICIDLSGAILGYSKFLLRYAHVSTTKVYQNLTLVYALLRVVGPLVDTVIIVWTEVRTRGGLFVLGGHLITEDGSHTHLVATDWTQLYFWAMAVLNSFNIYFFYVIRARARLPPHVVASLERTGCH